MKRIIKIVFVSIILICFFALNALALTTEDFSKQVEAFEGYKLFSLLDEDTKNLLNEIGVDGFSVESLLELSPKKVIDVCLSMVSGGMKAPLHITISIFGIVILFSLIECYLPETDKNKNIYGYIFILFATIILIKPIAACIGTVASVIRLTSNFMLLLIPILAGIITASGNPLLALSYNSLAFTSAQIISQITDSIIVPASGVYLALNICGSVHPLFHIQSITDLLLKIITIILSFLGSIFSGLLTIRAVLAGAVDNLSLKGAKFIIGTIVPIVGSSISDALASVVSGLAVVKTSVGIVGIIIIALINLPVLINLVLWIIALKISSIMSEFLGQEEITRLTNGFKSGLLILISLIVFNLFIMIISIGIVLAIQAGK